MVFCPQKVEKTTLKSCLEKLKSTLFFLSALGCPNGPNKRIHVPRCGLYTNCIQNYGLYLCGPNGVLHVQCALVGTPLSLLQRQKLSSMVPNSAFLVHIDSCRPTRGQIKPPGKRRVFFYLFSPSVFSREKIKNK